MENIITTKRLELIPMNNNDIDFIFMLDTRYETYKYESDIAPTYDKIIENCNYYDTDCFAILKREYCTK